MVALGRGGCFFDGFDGGSVAGGELRLTLPLRARKALAGGLDQRRTLGIACFVLMRGHLAATGVLLPTYVGKIAVVL